MHNKSRKIRRHWVIGPCTPGRTRGPGDPLGVVGWQNREGGSRNPVGRRPRIGGRSLPGRNGNSGSSILPNKVIGEGQAKSERRSDSGTDADSMLGSSCSPQIN
eukprot:15459191-Alexandrium_andersonii.AAC.1